MTIQMHDHMSLSISRPPDSTVDCVRIIGEVDLSNSRALGLAARALIEADASIIYIDLGGITFMGSTLVAFLVHIGNANGHARRPLVLCRPTPMARKVIHMSGLDGLVTIRPDLPGLWSDAARVEPAGLPQQ
jgi:anti-anti-sigma factor